MAADDRPAFADLLRHARRAAVLTHEELAERAGLSVRGISDLERGVVRAPHRDTLEMLAAALAISQAERQQWEQARRRHATRTPAASRARHAPASRTNLPIPLTPLVGRGDEIVQVRDLLRGHAIRLVTLTGVGGVGKTRLAIAVADRLHLEYQDGIWLVELAALNDPALVLSGIAAALNIQDLPGQSALTTLSMHLADKRLLVILDNFEHVVDAAAELAKLFAQCPRLAVLVTSRVPLHIQPEHEYPVHPLPLPAAEHRQDQASVTRSEAVRLFVARALAVDPAFVVTAETAPVLAEICARLDGLPLAIELAAAHVRVFAPRALLHRLERPLPLLVGGPRDLPARQQTLRSTIAWSYDVLAPEAQALFRRLAVFRGGWDLDAAEAVVGGDLEIDVLAGLEHLVEHNLVVVSTQPDGEPRFTLLETIREFALERLTAAGEIDHTRRRHAALYLERANPLGAEVDITDATMHAVYAAEIQFEADVDNLRAALGWTLEHSASEPALLDMVLRFHGFLWDVWRKHGRLTEGRRWVEAALAKSAGAADASRALALNAAGLLATEQADLTHARAFHEEALAIAADLEIVQTRAMAFWGLGRVALQQNQYEQAAAAFEEAVVLVRPLGVNTLLIGALDNLGAAATGLGDYSHAIQVLEEALTLCRATPAYPIEFVLSSLGYALLKRGDRERARELLMEGVRLFQSGGRSRFMAEMLEWLAQIAVAEEQPERALQLLGFTSLLREEIGTPLSPADRADLDRLLDATRAQIPAPQVEAAWIAGRALSLDAAIDLALNPPETPEFRTEPSAPTSTCLTCEIVAGPRG